MLALHIDSGGILRDSNNVKIQLIGTNESTAGYQGITTPKTFNWPIDAVWIAGMKAASLSCLRINLNEDLWLQKHAPVCTTYRADVIAAVALLTSSGIYCVINFYGRSLDTLNPYGMPNTIVGTGSTAFWTDVVKSFASEPGVIFDVVNEPCCGITAAQVNAGGVDGSGNPFQGVNAMIAIVRANESITHVCIAEPRAYSGNINEFLANLPTDTGPVGYLACSWHYYRDNNNDTGWMQNFGGEYFLRYARSIMQAGYHVVIGECGYDNGVEQPYGDQSGLAGTLSSVAGQLQGEFMLEIARYCDMIGASHLWYSWGPGYTVTQTLPNPVWGVESEVIGRISPTGYRWYQYLQQRSQGDTVAYQKRIPIVPNQPNDPKRGW